MAVVIQASPAVSVVAGNTLTLTFDSPITTGNVVFVGVLLGYNAEGAVSITDNTGNIYDNAISASTAFQASPAAMIFVAVNVASARVLTVHSDIPASMTAVAVEIGLAGVDEEDVQVASTHLTDTPTKLPSVGPVTGAHADTYTMALFVQNTGGANITPPAGWTVRATQTDAAKCCGQVIDRVLSSPGSLTPQWTLSANDWWAAASFMVFGTPTVSARDTRGGSGAGGRKSMPVGPYIAYRVPMR